MKPLSLKKGLTLFLSFVLLFSTLSATGAGFQAGIYHSVKLNQDGQTLNPVEVNITGSVRLTRLPLVFGSGICADTKGDLGLSAFADWWVNDNQLVNICNLYSGFGFSTFLESNFDDKNTLTLGSRFFIGLNWLFTDNFYEFYLQQNIVPAFCLSFSDLQKDFKLYFPLEAGLRFHF